VVDVVEQEEAADAGRGAAAADDVDGGEFGRADFQAASGVTLGVTVVVLYRVTIYLTHPSFCAIVLRA